MLTARSVLLPLRVRLALIETSTSRGIAMNTSLIELAVTGSSAAAWPLPVSAVAPRCARQHTRWFLDGSPMAGGELTETAVLIVSELVTNAYAAAAALPQETEIGLA